MINIVVSITRNRLYVLIAAFSPPPLVYPLPLLLVSQIDVVQFECGKFSPIFRY